MSKLRGEPWTTQTDTTAGASRSSGDGYYTGHSWGIKKAKSLRRHGGDDRAYAGDGMLLHQDEPPTSSDIVADPASEQWIAVRPGLRRLVTPKGPWFQYKDAAGFEWNTYELSIPQLPAGLQGFRIVQ